LFVQTTAISARANATQQWCPYKVRDVRMNNVRINDKMFETVLSGVPVKA